MMRRFRMIAGPNGSGKSTLVRRLHDEYAVNFYDILNADDILAKLKVRGAYSPRFPIAESELVDYAVASTYDESVKDLFRSGKISVERDCVRFSDDSINSYTVALFTNFLQHTAICRGESFSQETVFSHASKIEALKLAKASGYRTYLYFIATESPAINCRRVANRFSQGGHNVPTDRINARYARSIANVKAAIPYLSRAFFFDNSGPEMRYLGCYSEEGGFIFNFQPELLPGWLLASGLQ